MGENKTYVVFGANWSEHEGIWYVHKLNPVLVTEKCDISHTENSTEPTAQKWRRGINSWLQTASGGSTAGCHLEVGKGALVFQYQKPYEETPSK